MLFGVKVLDSIEHLQKKDEIKGFFFSCMVYRFYVFVEHDSFFSFFFVALKRGIRKRVDGLDLKYPNYKKSSFFDGNEN